MAETTIAWTDRVWNPTRGCSRVSPGCGGPGRIGGCYAERQAHRFNYPGGPYEGLTRMTENGARWTGKVRLVPELLDEPHHWRKPQRVFVNSMSDLFHERLTKTEIEQVFDVMSNAPQHTFQVLTKRPERMREWMEWRVERRADLAPNVWLGVSVEDQATADERIPLLLKTPAAVRFVSYEPALGPADFSRWIFDSGTDGEPAPRNNPGVDWIIVGGESGPTARPFDVAWARSVVEQCKTAGVACFVKQLGRRPLDSEGRHNAHIASLKAAKGDDPAEWPASLRVQEFPR